MEPRLIRLLDLEDSQELNVTGFTRIRHKDKISHFRKECNFCFAFRVTPS